MASRASRILSSLNEQNRKSNRFKLTRAVKDPKVPKQHQRSGWLAFDTSNPTASHRFFSDREEAKAHVNRKNQE